jgi:4-amino-4-deoxy-L-arabinose transferase-like glycosyltransferase
MIGQTTKSGGLRSPSRRLYLLVGCFCLLLFGLQSAYFIREKSITWDEAAHIAAGISAWHTGDFHVFVHNPPLVRQLATIPLLAMGVHVPLGEGWQWGRGTVLMNEMAYAYPGRFHNLVMAPRAVILFIMLFFGALLWHDAHTRFGRFAGLVCVALYSFQPMLIAHGSIATVDAASAFFFYIAVRTFIRFHQRGWNWTRASLMGLALGVAFSAKFTNVTLLIIMPVLAVILRSRGPGTFIRSRKMIGAFLQLGLAMFVVLFVINVSYGFDGTFHRLDSHNFKSRSFSLLASFLPGSTRVPLPYRLVEGFDSQSEVNETQGWLKTKSYWMGRWVRGRVVFLFPWLVVTKLTIPLIVLVAVSVGLRLYQRLRRGTKKGGDRIWAAYATVILIHFVIISNMAGSMTFRYLLAIVPFLILLGSEAAENLSSLAPIKWRLREIILIITLCSSLATAALDCPHYLAYNNAFLGGTERARKLDADACSQWGQDLIGLKKWMDRNAPAEKLYLICSNPVEPHFYGLDGEIPLPEPAPGIWAVTYKQMSRPDLYGINVVKNSKMMIIESKEPYLDWLKSEKPIDRVGRTLLIYRIADKSRQ